MNSKQGLGLLSVVTFIGGAYVVGTAETTAGVKMVLAYFWICAVAFPIMLAMIMERRF